ncbi:AAA family ATPase [Isoptericola sp. NPDC056578]|uniref:AAA family ATPase n=1 Tax=Isoptericola sp. NPDC056578 TaxID=3345870 RepID=UPI0036B3D0FB
MADPRVVGRADALAAVDGLLGAAREAPAGLALTGPPGIGKTTVWLAAVDRARDEGATVLAGRPAPAEVRLEYAGLAELLAPLTAAARRLPLPQRRALDAALGLETSGPAGGPQLVAAAVRALVGDAAARGPVLVAVDDLQWLDPSSRQAISFACRRATGFLAVLSCARSSDGPGPAADDAPVPELEPADPRRLVRLALPALAPDELLAVVQDRGVVLDAVATTRLVAAAGGNPLFAIQLAEHWRAQGRPDGLPATLRALVDARVSRLPAGTRTVLLSAACLADPRLAHLAVLHDGDAAVGDALAPAEDAGVVRLDQGRVRFTHPLFAAGVLDATSPGGRRARHRALADVVGDGEARARHLAHAATGADPETLGALDAAAEAARRRGATSVAAELEDLALGLGVREPARLLRAAEDQLRTDAYGRALGLAAEALPDLTSPLERARALGTAGRARFRLGDLAGSVAALSEAVALAGADPDLHVSLLGDLATGLLNSGQVELGRTCLVDAAAGRTPSGTDDGAGAELLAGRAVLDQLTGRGYDESLARRALAAEDPGRAVPAIRWPTVNVASALFFTGRPADALGLLLDAERRCVDRGQETDLWYVQFYLARAATLVGELGVAEGAAARLEGRARVTEGPLLALMAATARAHLGAWTGDAAAALPTARAATARFTELGAPHVAVLPAAALGAVLLAAGDAPAVVELLLPLERHVLSCGYRHPGFAGVVTDLVAALAATGGTAAAAEVLDGYGEAAARPGGAWLRGVLARGWAGVAAGTGETGRARGLLDDALAAFPPGYERGRTLLDLARLERRARRRAAAGDAARRAVRELEAVGCTLWGDVARAEADRVSGPSPGASLTAMEARVCALAAAGRTNREVAVALSMSAKTVEAHLSRAYAKLGIRSRAELGALAGRGELPHDEGSP